MWTAVVVRPHVSGHKGEPTHLAAEAYDNRSYELLPQLDFTVLRVRQNQERLPTVMDERCPNAMEPVNVVQPSSRH